MSTKNQRFWRFSCPIFFSRIVPIPESSWHHHWSSTCCFFVSMLLFCLVEKRFSRLLGNVDSFNLFEYAIFCQFWAIISWRFFADKWDKLSAKCDDFLWTSTPSKRVHILRVKFLFSHFPQFPIEQQRASDSPKQVFENTLLRSIYDFGRGLPRITNRSEFENVFMELEGFELYFECENQRKQA